MNHLRPGRLFLQRAMVITGLMVLLVVPALTAAQTMQQVQITLKEFMITPMEITVTQGEPVQFTVTNAGTIDHDFKVELSDQNIEKELFATDLMPGETRIAEYTFSVAGDWEMYCPVDSHEAHGMKGDIHVLSTSPGGMPSTGRASGNPSTLARGYSRAGIAHGGLSLSRRHTL